MVENPSKNGDKRDNKGRFTAGNKYGKGRPEGSLSLVSLLKEKLEKVPENERLSFAEAVIEALVKKAIVSEDIGAIREILNRVDGMPKESIDIKGEGIPVALVRFVGKDEKITDDNEDASGSES